MALAPRVAPSRSRGNVARGRRTPGRTAAVRPMVAGSGPVNKGPLDEGFWRELQEKRGAGKVADARNQEPGGDAYVELSVSLKEAVLGEKSKPLTFLRKGPCDKCKGRGLLPSTAIPCSACEGRGTRRADKTVEVNVPSGVSSGQQLRLSGLGDAGKPPGDLIVRIEVRSDAEVRRKGADLYSDLDFVEAGGSVCVTLLDGSKGNLKVPEGVKPGTALRVKGRGAPIKVGSEERGDHLFVVKAVRTAAAS
mmetsp:Transcript_19332/g.65707  ORF Transcript_19332/g.65707 Transcript_19332/m.65707 type:complete len:250 (+) Transcript_19332:3-752(+)